MITLPITPVPAPRQVRSDAWRPRPPVVRYNEFKDLIRFVHKVEIPEDARHVHMEFRLPMPKSWAKKKKAAMLGLPHRRKPDIDNLIKAFLDASLHEDGFISSVSARKCWSDEGGISYVILKEELHIDGR